MREWKAHSYEKISILADYLQQFVKAARKAPNRVYIDAFAGETQNRLSGSDRTFPGSAEIALSVSPPFTQVRLFEKSPSRACALRELASACGHSGVEVIEGDCNVRIKEVLAGLPRKAPTFAFVDPDGMEIEWSTIRALAEHKRPHAEQGNGTKVEMWILFSTTGIVRVLGGNREHVESSGLLDRVAKLYGAWGPWQAVWEARLDGRITPGDAKKAYLYLYMDRLVGLGYRRVLVRPIHATHGELYAMVFTTDHTAGRKLMQWAQEKDRVRPDPGRLFDPIEPRPAYEDLYAGWREELGIELPPWEDLK